MSIINSGSKTQAVVYTLIVFLIVFALLYLNALRQVRFSTAMSLVKSENTGEKPPKANPVLGVLGLILLIAAYVIAVRIETPLKAAALFFVAVILVIIGTYLIMIAGSVVFLSFASAQKELLLQSKSLCLGFVNGLPYEEQRSRSCLNLHTCNNGARYDIINIKSLLRRKGLMQCTLSARFCIHGEIWHK